MPSHHDRTTFYLIRHAESEMNTKSHLVGGRSNETPITVPVGHDQSYRLGKYLVRNQIIPDKVYATRARRTQETALYSLDSMGLLIAPIIADEIQELSQGSAEGKPRDKIYTPEVLAAIEAGGKNFKLPGGESMNEVGTRVYDWMCETATEDPEANDIFVYTHGGAITYLASRILGWSHADTYAFQKTVANTSVSKFVFEDGELAIEYLARMPE